MPLTRITIPTLTGGVSRQPSQTRFPNQVEKADNVTLDQVRGLEKRPGTNHKFVTDIDDDYDTLATHWIERTSTEQYVIVVVRPATGSPEIKAYNVLTGASATITYSSGAVRTAIETYLSTAGEIRMATVADTTLCWNTGETTATSGASTTYSPILAKYTNTAGDPVAVVDFGDFPQPPTAKTSAEDRTGAAIADASVAFKCEALRAFPGYPPGFYEPKAGSPQGVYYERIKSPNADSDIDQTTMPFEIKSTSAGVFTVDWIDWNSRMTGDDDTNPPPSFIGKPITDLTFFRNRIWIGAQEQLVASQSGDLFNFWVDDPSNLVASDPIDVTVGTGRYAPIQYLTPFQRSLVIHTIGDQQFEVRSNAAISPTDVQILPSTNYEKATSRPRSSGSRLFFSTERSGAAQLYEYLFLQDATVSSADDVAAHAYGYIPTGVTRMAHSEASGQVFLWSPGEPKNIYVYTYMLMGDDQKTQSAWCRWSLNHDIVGINVLDQILYVIRKDSSTGHLAIDSMTLLTPVMATNPDGMDYPVRLDSREAITGVYDAATNETSWTTSDATHDSLVNGPGWGNRSGVYRTGERVGSALKIAGDWSAHPMIVGTAYDMDFELSEQYVRDQQGAPVVGSLQLKTLTVYHRDTSFYEVTVDPNGRSPRVAAYTAKTIGALDLLLNRNIISPPVKQNFPIMASASGVKISITSDNPAPVNITGLEFATGFVPGKRSGTED